MSIFQMQSITRILREPNRHFLSLQCKVNQLYLNHLQQFKPYTDQDRDTFPVSS